jgi:hypothetical protein
MAVGVWSDQLPSTVCSLPDAEASFDEISFHARVLGSREHVGSVSAEAQTFIDGFVGVRLFWGF